jgi:hypothetical protein
MMQDAISCKGNAGLFVESKSKVEESSLLGCGAV